MKKNLDEYKKSEFKNEDQDLKDQKEKEKSSNDFKSWFYNIGLKS
jgi:hypothetical protein